MRVEPQLNPLCGGMGSGVCVWGGGGGGRKLRSSQATAFQVVHTARPSTV